MAVEHQLGGRDTAPVGHGPAHGRLAALVAVGLWGISFVATKAALGEIAPGTLIFLRFGLGVAMLFVILLLRREPLGVPRQTLPMLALMGFLGVFLHQSLQVRGLALTTAIRTGWLIGLIPIWTAVLGWRRERIGRGKALGLLLGTLGAVVVITRGQLSSAVLALPSTAGDLLIVASTVNWALYSMIGGATLRRVGSLRATALVMLFGWLMGAPWFLADSALGSLAGLSTRAISAVLFLGVGCSGIGYLAWYWALERLPASSVTAFLYLEPLFTLAGAMLLLGESLSWQTLAGGLLVLGGVALVQKSDAARGPAAPRGSSGSIGPGNSGPPSNQIGNPPQEQSVSGGSS